MLEARARAPDLKLNPRDLPVVVGVGGEVGLADDAVGVSSASSVTTHSPVASSDSVVIDQTMTSVARLTASA